MRLQDAYSESFFAKLHLWRLLNERKPEVNISHKKMPSWEEHCRFFESKPYKMWFLIIEKEEVIGTIYVSNQSEVGIFIYHIHQGNGHGRQALKLLRDLYKGKLLANIAPGNNKSKALFLSSGFKPLQETYIIDEDEPIR